jgi:hypothetical protein
VRHVLRRGHRIVGAALLAALMAAPGSAQDEAALDRLVERASDYTVDFVTRFSNVVAEEEYVQSWRNLRRVLVSDFLFVQDLSGDYLAFRDVFRVNGNAVRDRDARIAALFLKPTSDSASRADQINTEGARHTIGGVFNNPLLGLAFLQPRFKARFRFVLGRTERGRKTAEGTTSDVWIVNYREQDRPTILRSPEGGDLPATGSYWIEADTGRILRSELQLPNDTIVSFFEFDERFGIAVPVRMTDRYRYQNNVVNGTATYTRFRRFDVVTDDRVKEEAVNEDAVKDDTEK